LSVTSTFETGRQKITLRELGRVKNGYTFVCENPVETLAERGTNRTLVKYGQLLDVEGKFGVQIIEFTKKLTSCHFEPISTVYCGLPCLSHRLSHFCHPRL
jgi:hypothetical protein